MILMKLAATVTVIILCSSQCEGSSLFPSLTILKELRNVSSDCLEQINNLDLESLITMFDASTKIPNGLLAGNYFDLGNFDECLDIDSVSPVGAIRGKFCLGTIPLPTDIQSNAEHIRKIRRINLLILTPRMLGQDKQTLGLHFSICVPHKCDAEEISTIETYNEKFCYSNNDEVKYSAGFVTTVVIIGLFLLIVVESTIYDLVSQLYKRKPRHQILIAFSALTNGLKLLDTSKNADQLLCLNGIRAISMMWVILGHTYSLEMSGPVANFGDLEEYQKSAENMFLVSASLSVDTFLVVGGLVTVYTFLKSADKKIKFNILLYYLHRYLRLTPALAITILIHANVVRYLGNGPLWGTIDSDLERPCRIGWWSAVLYVQNYHQVYCVPQSWYLSLDMQLFLLSPLILLPLVKRPKYTLYALGVLVLAGIAVPFAIGYTTGIEAMLGIGDTDKFLAVYYYQTYTRFGPYVIGMILGYNIIKLKKGEMKVKLNAVALYSSWIISICGMVACVYAPFESDGTVLSKSFILGFQRTSWAIALSTVIFLCVSGYGGPIDWILSRSMFQLLTKLSYSMYLVHYFVINVKMASLKTTYRFSNIETMMQFWGYFMYTLAVSIVLCLTFESPIIVIEKMLFGRERTRGTKKQMTGVSE